MSASGTLSATGKMDDSTMDLTSVSNTMNDTKKELLATQDKFEVILQENHVLKKRIELVEKVNEELENELTFLNSSTAKEKSKLEEKQNELDLANSKIKQLESLLEEEKLQIQRFIKEEKMKRETNIENYKDIAPEEGQIEMLTAQIQNLEIQLKEDLEGVNQMLEQQTTANHKIKQLELEKQTLHDELNETKEFLKQKTIDLRDLNESLESIREEKLLLITELQTLKTSDKHASRGNSLFAEVEENRQKVAAQREVLKLKYLNLKKVLSQKQVENNKLKLEIVKIRREEKDDEKSLHRDYSILVQTYKERISELEDEVRKLKQAEQPIIVNSDGNNSIGWVQTIIENARKEAKDLQAELDMRGSNYVVQGHQLFDSQKENRRLKANIMKMQSDIDELRLKLDTLKSAGNETVSDGISPPVMDVVVAYQKQKIVKFKEILQQNSSTSEEKEAQPSSETEGQVFNFPVKSELPSEDNDNKENI